MSPHPRWHPLDPVAARRILRAVDVPWWIAGGWAIDLFVGTANPGAQGSGRRGAPPDAARVLAALPEFEFFEAVRGSLHPLAPGARPPRDGQFALGPAARVSRVGRSSCMLDDADREDWVFRREPSIDALSPTPCAPRPRARAIWRPRFSSSTRQKTYARRIRRTSSASPRGSRRRRRMAARVHFAAFIRSIHGSGARLKTPSRAE